MCGAKLTSSRVSAWRHGDGWMELPQAVTLQVDERVLGMEHLACRTVLTQQLLERCCGFFEGDGALARTLEASERVQEQERLVWGAQAARLPRLDAADLLQPVIP